MDYVWILIILIDCFSSLYAIASYTPTEINEIKDQTLSLQKKVHS